MKPGSEFGSASWIRGLFRRRTLAPLAMLAALVVVPLVSLACGGASEPAVSHPPRTGGDVTVTVYRTPTCGCCKGHEDYLREHGFRTESEVMEDLGGVKERLGVPEEMWSCHTAVIGQYFIEGHVPVEAITRLLEERPAIDGIALPGMPAGSPGMGGEKEGPFVIYAVADGEVWEFMRV